MKKFERSDDSKLHPCIGCWSLLTATKNNQQQNLNHSFWPLLEFCHFRKKILPPYFFDGKSNFLQIIDSEPWFWKKVWRGLLSNRDIQWVKLIKTPHIRTTFYFLGIFSGFRKWQNFISGSDKTEIFIYKVPFTLHSMVEVIHNSTNAKEQKNSDNAIKKEPQR